MTADTAYCDWIAVDWGTSRLRAWAMAGVGLDARPKAEVSSEAGMSTLDRAGFEPALLDLVSPWLGAGQTEVVACGMVGSRQGWVEAPYRPVPAPPPSDPVIAPTSDPRIAVRVLPGLRQDNPPDVMRGEETQIAGFLATRPGFDGVLCLPGTHTKWAQISAGEVVSFRTFMTGELFALVSDHSLLRHTIGPGWDDAAFADALSDAIARPEAMAARLFALRAEGLLTGLAPSAARARASGLLVGAELAAARPYWLGNAVAVVGAPAQSKLYTTALRLQGLVPDEAPGDAMVLAGLAAAQAVLEPTP
ncbi:MAG: 2-dehydro-3-deoxygalactonokinase [Pseudomonadota bacterium]